MPSISSANIALCLLQRISIYRVSTTRQHNSPVTRKATQIAGLRAVPMESSRGVRERPLPSPSPAAAFSASGAAAVVVSRLQLVRESAVACVVLYHPGNTLGPCQSDREK